VSKESSDEAASVCAPDRSDEEGSWFAKCLGAWGTHADSEERGMVWSVRTLKCEPRGRTGSRAHELRVKVWIWSDILNEVVGIIADCEGSEP
jgi:hypothetical protein